MKSIISKNSRFILILGLVVFFLFVMVTPVSADLRLIVPDRGSKVFIGENNLDITNVMGGYHLIGWWASDNNRVQGLPPDVTEDVANSLTSFYVDPTKYADHTGRWFRLNTVTDSGYWLSEAFTVLGPTLDIKIWDINTGSDCTGQSIPPVGTHLTFRIETLYMYRAPFERSAYPATEGYITIVVKNENGEILNSLSQTNTVQNSLTNLVVTSPVWYWGGDYWSNNPGDKYWETNLYPAGTYTVNAVSTLNNMNNNYNYVGKTVSPTYTITLTTVTPTPTPAITTVAVTPTTPTPTPTITTVAVTPTTPTPTITTVAVTPTPTPTSTTVSVTPTPTPSITTVSVTSDVPTPPVTTVAVTSHVPTPPVTTVAVTSHVPTPPSTTVTTTPVAAGDQSGILNQILNYFKEIFGWK